MEPNPHCKYDAVTIFDSGGAMIHKYCGKNTQNLKVRFVDNLWHSYEIAPGNFYS